jgi:hypothetical protein
MDAGNFGHTALHSEYPGRNNKAVWPGVKNTWELKSVNIFKRRPFADLEINGCAASNSV